MYGSVRNVHLRTAVDPAALALQVGRPSPSCPHPLPIFNAQTAIPLARLTDRASLTYLYIQNRTYYPNL